MTIGISRAFCRLFRASTAGAVLATGLVGGGSANAQIFDPEEVTELFLTWAVNPDFPGPRAYIRTDRLIRQTGPASATFVQGEAQFVLADGAVGSVWRDQIIPFFDEWDTDQDGWRDVVEQEYQNQVGLTPAGTEWAFDPFYHPPAQQTPADVFWTILANGTRLPVRPDGSSPATVVLPFAGSSVLLASAPASPLPRPFSLFDYSTSFFVSVPGGSGFLNGLAVYHWNREYFGPSEGAQMEREILPSNQYQIQFPVVTNPATVSGTFLNHLTVPNGTLVALGQRRPTWIMRRVETFVASNRPFEEQRWENGRLVFDPVLVNYFTTDNIVTSGYGNANTDQVTLRILDDAGEIIWPFIGTGFVLPVAQDTFPLVFGDLYGTPGLGGLPTSPLAINGEMVLLYERNVTAPATGGDVSTVELRIPVRLAQSYQSWRNLFFAGANIDNVAFSGPQADPDGDGIDNQGEFDGGTNPTVPDFGPQFLALIDTDDDELNDGVEINETLTDPETPSFGTAAPQSYPSFNSSEITGTYYGIVFNKRGQPVSYQEVRLSNKGSVSARLSSELGRSSYRATLGSDGRYSGAVSGVPSATAVSLSLEPDEDNGDFRIRGSFESLLGPIQFFELRRAAYSRSVPTGLGGSYTFFAPVADSDGGPTGDLVGTGTVGSDGRCRFRIYMPDGNRASQSSYLVVGNHLPFFGTRTSTVIGNLQFRNGPNDSDFDGSVCFSRPGGGRDQFAGGFDQTRVLEGMRYSTPSRGRLPVSGFQTGGNNAVVQFSSGDLDGIMKVGTWDDRGKINVERTSIDRMTAKSNSRDGLVTIDYRIDDPGAGLSKERARGYGVVLQGRGEAAGYYKSGSSSGSTRVVENETSLPAAEKIMTVVSPANHYSGVDEVTYTVTVETDGAWEVEVPAGADWISASTDGGSGDGTVDITLEENLTGLRRWATITIAGRPHYIQQDYR